MLIFLTSLHSYIFGLGIFKYITFRSVVALLIAMTIVFVIGNKSVEYLKGWQGKGQPIRDDGPQTHFKKIGTPTMGGLMILFSVLLASLICGNFYNLYFWLILIIMFIYGAIGFYDDYLKVIKQNSKGVSAGLRLLMEFAVALLIAYIINIYADNNSITVPFIKICFLNLGWLFIPFAALVIVGTANAVNFTDGLDGLAIVPVMIAAASFAFIAYFCGNSIFANYLDINFVSGAGEIAIVLAALVGAGIGFLWFNAPPAAMFMGDTGSLALGAVLGTAAVFTGQELVLVVIGGIFVMEALSVIIQVLSFKLRKKRIFLMAPIHHHFEKKGWSESQVVIRFWIISFVLALIGLISFKIR